MSLALVIRFCTSLAFRTDLSSICTGEVGRFGVSESWEFFHNSEKKKNKGLVGEDLKNFLCIYLYT